MKDPSLVAVIAAVGSIRKLADALGISHQAVSHWKRVPAERARTVAKIARLPLSRVRPDIWPPSGRKKP